eukprot:205254-Rhodomonas_salina.1
MLQPEDSTSNSIKDGIETISLEHRLALMQKDNRRLRRENRKTQFMLEEALEQIMTLRQRIALLYTKADDYLHSTREELHLGPDYEIPN